jgi:6-phosphofructokinase 1
VILAVLQDILATGEQDTDLSGNPILKDTGLWMRNELKGYFKDADIKYIDPSYMIRSTPTISADRIYCKVCDPCVLGAEMLMQWCTW